MKKITLTFLFTAAVLLSANAQSKIAYLNSLRIIALMPESTKVDEKLKKEAATYEKEFEGLRKELEQKAANFQKKLKTWSKSMQETKGKEIQALQERIQTYRNSAGKELEEKRQTLMAPILEKAQKVIDEIAKKEGYDYIIDVSKGTLLFANEDHNLFEKVKKALGIKDAKASAKKKKK